MSNETCSHCWKVAIRSLPVAILVGISEPSYTTIAHAGDPYLFPLPHCLCVYGALLLPILLGTEIKVNFLPLYASTRFYLYSVTRGHASGRSHLLLCTPSRFHTLPYAPTPCHTLPHVHTRSYTLLQAPTCSYTLSPTPPRSHTLLHAPTCSYTLSHTLTSTHAPTRSHTLLNAPENSNWLILYPTCSQTHHSHQWCHDDAWSSLCP